MALDPSIPKFRPFAPARHWPNLWTGQPIHRLPDLTTTISPGKFHSTPWPFAAMAWLDAGPVRLMQEPFGFIRHDCRVSHVIHKSHGLGRRTGKGNAKMMPRATTLARRFAEAAPRYAPRPRIFENLTSDKLSLVHWSNDAIISGNCAPCFLPCQFL